MAFAQPGGPVQREADDGDGVEGLANEEDEDEEEGYGCPFETCGRHKQPWPLKKTWRWREHMKRSHKYSKGGIEKLEAELKSKRVGNGEADATDRGGGQRNDRQT